MATLSPIGAPAPKDEPPVPEKIRINEISLVIQEAIHLVAAHIHSLVTSILSILALAVIFPLNLEWFDPKKRSECDLGQPSILLIHGFLGSSNNWLYHRYRLHKAGYKNVFTVNLGDPRQSIEEYAKKVAVKVQKIQEITGRKELVMIGHSMGGLVAQEYRYGLLQDQSQETKIITIGTPCLGTHMAHLASRISKAAREMIPGSALLTNLQARAKVDLTTRYCHVAAEMDSIVFPVLSSLGGESNLRTQHLLQSIGHIAVLFSPAVADIVINDLTSTTV